MYYSAAMHNSMDTVTVRRKPVIIGVMGSATADDALLKDAFALGQAIASKGYVLLTGGGPGIMRAASEGACRAGGLVLAVLPNERTRPREGYPNEFVDISVYTGMNDARNIINAKTPDVIIAVNGGPGTLSEIAIALKAGTPVVGLRAPRFELDDAYPYYPASSVDEALTHVETLLGSTLPTERKD